MSLYYEEGIPLLYSPEYGNTFFLWNFVPFNCFVLISAIAFFDHINLVYGTISEFCTMSGCPDMTGPGLR
jgi:hypothetical protein